MIGRPLVELVGVARMDADGRGAGGHETRRHAQARLVAAPHPGPDLHRHRRLAGHLLDDGLHTGDRQVRRTEQSRAGAGLHDLVHRASQVQVDEVGAGREGAPRRAGEHGRLGGKS